MLFSSCSTLVLSSVTSFPPEAGALGPEPALILGGTPVPARKVEVVGAILALPATGLVTPVLAVVVPVVDAPVL